MIRRLKRLGQACFIACMGVIAHIDDTQLHKPMMCVFVPTHGVPMVAST
mgnify:CR=1 FL=1